MDVQNVKYIQDVLEHCGRETEEYRFSDGTVLLAMPYGGRVIGLCSVRNGHNFFWTHPALRSGKEAKAFYAQSPWHNSGGDRTWLAPEIDIFFPKFPDMSEYTPPPQVDPGRFTLVRTKNGLVFSNRLSVKLSRSQHVLPLVMSKQVSAAENPVPMEGVEYAGYTSSTTLEIQGADKDPCGTVGLWHLMQLPCGGRMLVPTCRKAEPRIVFGDVSEGDFDTTEHLCAYTVSGEGSCKFSLEATAVTGRTGYTYAEDGQQTLVVRNFFVNPSGTYVDVPFDDPQRMGFAVQACKINNTQWGHFCEMEYHAPAIGSGTGLSECRDVCQTWAFRGEPAKINLIISQLLTPCS